MTNLVNQKIRFCFLCRGLLLQNRGGLNGLLLILHKITPPPQKKSVYWVGGIESHFWAPESGATGEAEEEGPRTLT